MTYGNHRVSTILCINANDPRCVNLQTLPRVGVTTFELVVKLEKDVALTGKQMCSRFALLCASRNAASFPAETKLLPIWWIVWNC